MQRTGHMTAVGVDRERTQGLTVVWLDDLSAADRGQIAAVVENLLVTGGVIGPNDRPDRLWQPSARKPGTRVRTAIDDTDWFDA
jgi:hypothetical protein